jgi:hypothetical protein
MLEEGSVKLVGLSGVFLANSLWLKKVAGRVNGIDLQAEKKAGMAIQQLLEPKSQPVGPVDDKERCNHYEAPTNPASSPPRESAKANLNTHQQPYCIPCEHH